LSIKAVLKYENRFLTRLLKKRGKGLKTSWFVVPQLGTEIIHKNIRPSPDEEKKKNTTLHLKIQF